MPTFYKPTEIRRKRVVFRSIDPDEAKKERQTSLLIIGMIALSLLTAAALAVWIK